MQTQSVPVNVYFPEKDDEVDGMPADRYEFSLTDRFGNVHKFIVDLPNEPGSDRTVDVWLLGATVEVGDTPEDGFASFTPNAQL